MKSAQRVAAALLVASFTGCTPSGLLRIGRPNEKMRIYPASDTSKPDQPATPIYATITGVSSGAISVVLPSGETWQGNWAFVDRDDTGAQTPNGEKADRTNLNRAWSSIFSSNFYNAKVQGQRRSGCGVIHGTAGTRIDIEFIRENSPNKGLYFIGVAVDSKGNQYQVSL